MALPSLSLAHRPTRDEPVESRVRWVWAVIALTAFTTFSYLNSFSGPFVFDDLPSITDNPTLRTWSPLWGPLLPPSGTGITVEGRPILNFSLAINHAFGGTRVTGYHLVNLLIHLAAALVIFDLTRLTFLTPRLRPRYGTAALPLAFATALLWAVHPLQTESVTYVIQRAESLMTLFYVLTLYCFRRSTSSIRPAAWLFAGTLACLLGMGTKEIMVSAPLLALCYDRAFISGSFARAWQAHRRWYAALAATYLLLASLVIHAGNRGGTAGLNLDITWWKYALTELVAVTHYLSLAFWPHPLVFDYGTEWVTAPAQLIPAAALIFGLLIATAVAGWKNSPLAFPALLFFAVLAPTSSVLPGNRQTSAEHRMYLPLASVTVLTVVGLHRLLVSAKAKSSSPALLLGASAVVFGALTFQRNETYRSEQILYQDTVAKKPLNYFARYNLAKNLADSGQPAAALPHYEAALQLQPAIAYLHYNYANALSDLARWNDAIRSYQSALRLDPNYVKAHYNLGNALVQSGRKADALASFEKVLQLQPDHVEALDNLGSVLFDLGRLSEARQRYEAALRLNPRLPEAHVNLGNVLWLQGDTPAAVLHFNEALRLDPSFAPAVAALQRVREKTPPTPPPNSPDRR
jgi:tetratricopeptide (TPR) repeat protein